MISATEFKNGVTIEIDGIVYSVLEFQHVKPGKGAAFVRTKLRNLTNGGVIDKTFRPTEKMQKAHIERTNLEYLYSDEDMYHFMDPKTFDQMSVNKDDIGDSLKFIKENIVIQILMYNGKIFGIEPPISVELEVIQTEPGFKGDTSQGATKPATVETGATVNVPLFVNVGDIIKIDTRTSEYTGRA